MRFLTELIGALVRFVQRNPLTVLVILLLAIGAPALLRGIALFILYGMAILILAVIAAVCYFRWRMYRIRREMESRFGGEGAPSDGTPFGRYGSTADAGREGDVHVRRTADAPEKRVASDVGDYVDFEETREP